MLKFVRTLLILLVIFIVYSVINGCAPAPYKPFQPPKVEFQTGICGAGCGYATHYIGESRHSKISGLQQI